MSTQDAASAPTIAEAVFDLSRGRQALLSVAQPALGALLAIGHLPAARVMVLGSVAATAGYLAVFSLNDVLDVKVDEAALGAGRAEAQGMTSTLSSCATRWRAGTSPDRSRLPG